MRRGSRVRILISKFKKALVLSPTSKELNRSTLLKVQALKYFSTSYHLCEKPDETLYCNCFSYRCTRILAKREIIKAFYRVKLRDKLRCIKKFMRLVSIQFLKEQICKIDCQFSAYYIFYTIIYRSFVSQNW